MTPSDLIHCPRCGAAGGNLIDPETRTTIRCQYCLYPVSPELADQVRHWRAMGERCFAHARAIEQAAEIRKP